MDAIESITYRHERGTTPRAEDVTILLAERDRLRELLSEWHERHVVPLDKNILSGYPESLEWRTHEALHPQRPKEDDRGCV